MTDIKVNPWLHSQATIKTKQIWGQADIYYDYWHMTKVGYHRLGKHFNEVYSFQNMVRKFVNGWIPIEDLNWRHFYGK